MELQKSYIGDKQFRLDSQQLGIIIFDSGFKPDYVVGIARGGTVPGINVYEVLNYLGVKCDYVEITANRYRNDKIGVTEDETRIFGLDDLVGLTVPDSRVLFVDDLWDEGKTARAIIQRYQERAKSSAAKEIKFATAYVKDGNDETKAEPDFHYKKVDGKRWRVFPHELCGHTIDTIREHHGNEIANQLEARLPKTTPE